MPQENNARMVAVRLDQNRPATYMTGALFCVPFGAL
jgi:hypothetical protein